MRCCVASFPSSLVSALLCAPSNSSARHHALRLPVATASQLISVFVVNPSPLGCTRSVASPPCCLTGCEFRATASAVLAEAITELHDYSLSAAFMKSCRSGCTRTTTRSRCVVVCATFRDATAEIVRTSLHQPLLIHTTCSHCCLRLQGYADLSILPLDGSLTFLCISARQIRIHYAFLRFSFRKPCPFLLDHQRTWSALLLVVVCLLCLPNTISFRSP